MRQYERAVKPEPGDAQDRQEHSARFASGAQVVPDRSPGPPVDAQLRRGWPDRWNREAYQKADCSDCDDRGADGSRVASSGEQSREQRAEQDRYERSHLHERITADQFCVVQHFGQDAVLRRREERGVHAHHEQRGHERRQVLARKPEGGERHDHDLDRLDDLEHERLVETIRQLACHAREEHEGQNEDATGEIGQKPRIECRVSARVISGENDQDVLVDVVIERSQRLCAEER